MCVSSLQTVIRAYQDTASRLRGLQSSVHAGTLKGCLDWDSFATFLRLFRDADAQVATQASGLFCVDSSDRAVLGSKSRLRDSNKTLGGVTLNSATADTTERGCTMADSQLSRDSVILLLEEWR